MYEELVSVLREKAEFLACAEPLNIKNAFAESMKQAADAIEELSKRIEFEHQSGFADGQIAANRKKPRWIPVTERLPEPYFDVLATDGESVGVASYQAKGGYWLGAEIFDDCHVAVTHWRTLPEPPKEAPT